VRGRGSFRGEVRRGRGGTDYAGLSAGSFGDGQAEPARTTWASIAKKAKEEAAFDAQASNVSGEF